MPRPPKKRPASPRTRSPASPTAAAEPSPLRIVGGTMWGRKIAYSGDERTRPMKDRVREAVFNLVGPAVKGTHAIDLFAGTGALGFEALSRGASRATFLEQHFPTARLIEQNARQLGVKDQCRVVPGDVFAWGRRGPALDEDPARPPWLAFCSPPFVFYAERKADMLELLAVVLKSAPPGSICVIEADTKFDFASLPDPAAWQVRHYPPAVVGILRT